MKKEDEIYFTEKGLRIKMSKNMLPPGFADRWSSFGHDSNIKSETKEKKDD